VIGSIARCGHLALSSLSKPVYGWTVLGQYYVTGRRLYCVSSSTKVLTSTDFFSDSVASIGTYKTITLVGEIGIYVLVITSKQFQII
jgi:hypothetical protein